MTGSIYNLMCTRVTMTCKYEFPVNELKMYPARARAVVRRGGGRAHPRAQQAGDGALSLAQETVGV
eukprot:COSAG02_NODE_512_length_20850_cov_4.993302_23_plen_66_part_00